MNLTDCRKYCDRPAVINIRFVVRLEECCHFACSIVEKKIDNEHKVILTVIVRRQKSNKAFKFTVLQCISLPLGMGAIFLPK